jgi:CRP-like cAMP-binding protein
MRAYATVKVVVGALELLVEIALLGAVPRTATVIAHAAVTVYELDQERFLAAVLGHAPTLGQADRIAEARLATGAAPGHSDTSGADAAEPG